MDLMAQDATLKSLHFAISTNGRYSGEPRMEGPVPATKTSPHVAVVLGPADGALYLCGARVSADPNPTLHPADLPHPLDHLIGRSQGRSYDYFLDGNVDELRVSIARSDPTSFLRLPVAPDGER
jgi:hypothetical protein